MEAKLFRNTQSENQKFDNFPRIKKEVSDYLDFKTDQNELTFKSYQNLFQNLKNNKEKSQEYSAKLLAVQKDIGTFNKTSYSETIQAALKNNQKVDKTEFIVPISSLDPLICAYEEKIQILEEQVI